MPNRFMSDIIGDLKHKEQISWTEMKKELEDKEYLKIYNIFSRLLREEDFMFPYGIHGMAHTKRVLMLVLCLGLKLEIGREDLLLLSLCALIHDIGRIDDSVDPEHGQASFAKAAPILEKTGYDMELMRYIIENHCVDDKKGHANVQNYDLSDQVKAWRLLNIFKDADGLDRLRINALDPGCLRHDEARGLIRVARELLREIH